MTVLSIIIKVIIEKQKKGARKKYFLYSNNSDSSRSNAQKLRYLINEK